MFNKTLFVGVFLMGAMVSLNAQIESGTFRLGPQFGFLNRTIDIDAADDEMTLTEFNLAVSGSYFVAPNLGVGLNLGTSSAKVEMGSEEATSSSTSISVIGGYMIPLSEKLYLPVGAGVGYNFNNDDAGQEVKTSGIGFGISAGLEYFVSDNVGVNLSLGWNSASLEEEDETFELDVSEILATFGFYIYFN